MKNENIKKAAEQAEEALKKLAEIVKDMVEEVITAFRESGLMEFGCAAYLLDELRRKPRLERIERGYARATRITGDRYRIETSGPKEFSWTVEVSNGTNR